MVNISIIGRLGADAEVLDGKNGKFLKFRMATNEKKNNEIVTDWFNVTFNGDRFLKASEWLKKGKMVMVNGAESVSTYQANDGTTKISRDIRGYNFEFISNGESGGTTSNTNEEITVGTLKKEQPVAATTSIKTAAPVADVEDDLPF